MHVAALRGPVASSDRSSAPGRRGHHFRPRAYGRPRLFDDGPRELRRLRRLVRSPAQFFVGPTSDFVRRIGAFTVGRRIQPAIVRGTWPEVVPWELWERVVAIRRANRSDRIIGVDRRARAFTLSGLLTCGRCADNVRSKTYSSHGQPRRCSLCRRKDAAGLCDEPRADADNFEREIVEWLRAIRVEPAWQATYAGERTRLRGAATPAKTVAQRRREIDSEIERRRVAWEPGAVSDESAFRREIADLRPSA